MAVHNWQPKRDGMREIDVTESVRAFPPGRGPGPRRAWLSMSPPITSRDDGDGAVTAMPVALSNDRAAASAAHYYTFRCSPGRTTTLHWREPAGKVGPAGVDTYVTRLAGDLFVPRTEETLPTPQVTNVAPTTLLLYLLVPSPGLISNQISKGKRSTTIRVPKLVVKMATKVVV